MMYSDPDQAIVLHMRDGATLRITHRQILEQHAMLTAFRHAANSIGLATGVTRDHVDHSEAAQSVAGDHYFLDLIAGAELRYKLLADHSIPCPQHTTGGGPCYCRSAPVAPPPAKPLRRYTLTTGHGSKIAVVCQSLKEAVQLCGDADVVSSVSEPWTAAQEQAS